MGQLDCDIGVVLVHGIGTSKHGETLTSWGKPLLAELDIDLANVNVKLHKTPAALEFKAAGKRIRVVESWWGELFTAPSFRELALWSWRSVPTTLIAHFDERFRRTTNNYEQCRGKRFWPTVGLGLELFVLLFGLLLTPVVLFTLFILFVLYWIPQLRGFVQAIQTTLTSAAGDSLVFSQDGLLRDGIINKVKSDISEIRKHCTKCVVVAHSQGAAVAHKAIRRLIDAGENAPHIFVSFGSGVRKLTELRQYMTKDAENDDGRKIGDAVIVVASFAGMIVGLTAWCSDTPFTSAFLLTLYAMLVCVLGLWARMFGYRVYTKKNEDTIPASHKANCLGLLLIAFISAPILWAWMLLFDVSVPILWAWVLLFDVRNHAPAETLLGDVVLWAACPILLGLAFTFLMRWRHVVGRRTHVSDQRNKEEHLWLNKYQLRDVNWVDYYASFDPVPNGPLLDHYSSSRYHAVQIVNELSLLRDHTAYFPDQRQFVKEVASVVTQDLPVSVTKYRPLQKYRPLHLTSPYEIGYRGFTLASLALWGYVVLDTGLFQAIKKNAHVNYFTERCETITQNGIPDGCVDTGWIERIFDLSLPYALTLVAFIVLSWVALRVVREAFIKWGAGKVRQA